MLGTFNFKTRFIAFADSITADGEFDATAKHVLDTLEFKDISDLRMPIITEYESYSCDDFNIEYPNGWNWSNSSLSSDDVGLDILDVVEDYYICTSKSEELAYFGVVNGYLSNFPEFAMMNGILFSDNMLTCSGKLDPTALYIFGTLKFNYSASSNSLP